MKDNYWDCSGCGLMFNLENYVEMLEAQEHICEDDHTLVADIDLV